MSYAYALCTRVSLVADGDFVLRSVPGYLPNEVVAVNVKGRLFVFDNICPHRGAKIFKSEAGNMPLQCPYHGLGAEAIMAGANIVKHKWDETSETLIVYLDKKSGADL